MGIGEVVAIFHNANAGDIGLVAGALGTFVATFGIAVWNGVKLSMIGKTTKDVQANVLSAASSAEAAVVQTGQVHQSVQTIEVKINGRIQELIEAKERAARMEAQLEARIQAVESSAAAWSAALVESAKDPIVGKDMTGLIVSWNIAAEDLFGYTKSEVIGRAATILIPDESVDEEKFLIGQVQKGVQFDRFHCKRRRKDGRVLDLEATITPVLDRSGRPTGICAVYRCVASGRIASESFGDDEVLRGEPFAR